MFLCENSFIYFIYLLQFYSAMSYTFKVSFGGAHPYKTNPLRQSLRSGQRGSRRYQGGKASMKECILSLEWKDGIDVSVQTVTGSEFQNLGAETVYK